MIQGEAMTYYPPQWFEAMLEECRTITEVPTDAGALVWDFVVPAAWCPPGNRRDSMHWSKAHEMKKNLRAVMRNQARHLSYWDWQPLPGKPIVHLIRFASRRVDPRSNWDKFPVDMLTPQRFVPVKNGKTRHYGCLGLIEDDSGDHIDLRAEWRKSKLGVVYVRVFAES